MAASLKERFESFVKTLDGFESIDALLTGNEPHGKKRADYLFANRSIIVEQKVLEVDPNDKPQKFIDKQIRDGRVVVFGQVSTDAIFKSLPDGQEMKRRMLLKVASVIEADVSAADKQTRDTREIFGVPDATGILIILNEKAKTLTPDVIEWALHQAFGKVTETGERRYAQNVGVIFISELHAVASAFPGTAFPIRSMTNTAWPKWQELEKFRKVLALEWARFNGAAYFEQTARLTYSVSPDKTGPAKQ